MISIYLVVIVLFSQKFTGYLCLTGVKVVIPRAVKRGERAVLECHYNLEGDQLYSVKWYKRGREFYRYTPREHPPEKQFPIPGLRVLQTDSNATHVVLANVTMDNSGLYSCEVSADAPSFFTGIESAELQVVELPVSDPQIIGLKTRYHWGEVLKAQCVSKGSKPAANLTWLVDGEPVDPARIRHAKPYEDKGLLNAHSGLKLQITERTFAKGKLKIRCIASLYHIYHRSSERSVFIEEPQKRKSLAVAHATTTTLISQPTINWEYVVPVERPPQSTLIYTQAASSGGAETKMRLGNRLPSSVLLLIILLCAR